MVKRIRIPVYHECSGGEKTCDVIDSFVSLLEELGFKVVDDPRFEGSDMMGVLVSKTKLTKPMLKQLKKEFEDEWP